MVGCSHAGEVEQGVIAVGEPGRVVDTGYHIQHGAAVELGSHAGAGVGEVLLAVAQILVVGGVGGDDPVVGDVLLELLEGNIVGGVAAHHGGLEQFGATTGHVRLCWTKES